MSVRKVVIIIPTYNEALIIEETITKVFAETSNISNIDLHVLIFDSCSTDNTQNIIKKLQQQYSKLHLQTELAKTGLGNAYMQAMRYALNQLEADIVFEFDADLSHQPKYIEPMLAKLDNADVVIGSRYVAGGSIPKEWGFHRKLLSILGNWIARLVLSRKYKDFTSGFRATNQSFLRKVLPNKFLSNNYAYKIQLLWLLHKNHARICEYPIEFIDREKGISKLPANSIVDSLKVLFILRFFELQRYFKMCLVGLSGLFLQILIYNSLRAVFSPLLAVQISVLGAIISNFFLNNNYTFSDRTSKAVSKFKSLSIFVGYSLIIVFLQSFWLNSWVKHFGGGLIKENIFLLTGILLGSVLNYFTYSRIIWSEASPRPQ